YPEQPPILSLIMLLPPPTSTLFPYTTLFRSSRRYPQRDHAEDERERRHENRAQAQPRPLERRLDQLPPLPHFVARGGAAAPAPRSEEHTSELQSRGHLVCRPLLEKKKTKHST